MCNVCSFRSSLHPQLLEFSDLRNGLMPGCRTLVARNILAVPNRCFPVLQTPLPTSRLQTPLSTSRSTFHLLALSVPFLMHLSRAAFHLVLVTNRSSWLRSGELFSSPDIADPCAEQGGVCIPGAEGCTCGERSHVPAPHYAVMPGRLGSNTRLITEEHVFHYLSTRSRDAIA